MEAELLSVPLCQEKRKERTLEDNLLIGTSTWATINADHNVHDKGVFNPKKNTFWYMYMQYTERERLPIKMAICCTSSVGKSCIRGGR